MTLPSHLHHWHQWWIRLICTIMFQKSQTWMHLGRFSVSVLCTCPAFYQSRIVVLRCIHPRMHDSYLITESSWQWWPCDVRRVQHSCHHQQMGGKKTRALSFRCHSKWQFPPWDLQIVEACLLKTATWTWDNVITLMNIETLMKDPKPWTHSTYDSHKSNKHLHVCALTFIPLCSICTLCSVTNGPPAAGAGILFVFHRLPWPCKL